MRDLSAKQSRYLQDPLPTRLGNLASNLAHMSSFAKGAKNPTAVERLLDESRFFIEWAAADTGLETTAELVEMQVQLSWWYHHWQEEQTKPAEVTRFVSQTHVWSDRVLDLSGLFRAVVNPKGGPA